MTHTYTHTHTYKHTHTHIHTYTYIHTRIHLNLCRHWTLHMRESNIFSCNRNLLFFKDVSTYNVSRPISIGHTQPDMTSSIKRKWRHTVSDHNLTCQSRCECRLSDLDKSITSISLTSRGRHPVYLGTSTTHITHHFNSDRQVNQVEKLHTQTGFSARVGPVSVSGVCETQLFPEGGHLCRGETVRLMFSIVLNLSTENWRLLFW